MKTQRVVMVALALALAWTANAVAQQTAEERYQAGLYQEEVQGDLERAVEIYQTILSDHANNRAVAAKAQLHIGICYETLGLQDAQRAYERVVANYGEQSDVVRQARARLAALSQHAAAAAPGGTAAQMLLSSSNPADNIINSPGGLEPSPDGRRVAYAQTGGEEAGVYIRDLASGDVQQVAALDPTADGNNWSVVWSRDGKRLAFRRTDTETGTITINMLDLASRKADVVPGLDARGLRLLDWSRDGRYLLCNRRNTVELVTVEDGTMTTLADSTWTGQRASFSPDGRFVAFARGKYGSESVYTQPLAGGPRHRIADAREGVYLHPLWSPDGSAIAYQQPDGIWIAPVTDGVANGAPRLAYRTESARWAIKWTESGRFFLTLNEVRIPIHQVAVDPTTGQIESDTPQEIHETPESLQWFSWSPDGRHVAFSGWDSKIRIYAADSRTMTAYDVGPGPAANARWSEDGREVFYFTGDAGTRMAQMKALDVSSGEVRELFPPMPAPASPSLSADGRWMAHTRLVGDMADSGSMQVEVVVGETGQPGGRVVATTPPGRGVSWRGGVLLSPKGDQVAYRIRDAVWVVASDGTGARRLLTDPHILRASWDPSGRFIAYTTWTDSATRTAVLRVVEVATGNERGSLPLGTGRIGVTEWSLDGRFIGLIRQIPWWEFWVVENLLGGK